MLCITRCSSELPFSAAATGTRSACVYTDNMAAESGVFIHAEAVQRKSRVYRPGLTKAQTSSRVSPLAITARHRRQRPRPDGAALIWYVLCFCLKPLLLMRAGRGGGGAGAGVGMGALPLHSTGSSHTSGRRINEEPYMALTPHPIEVLECCRPERSERTSA